MLGGRIYYIFSTVDKDSVSPFTLVGIVLLPYVSNGGTIVTLNLYRLLLFALPCFFEGSRILTLTSIAAARRAIFSQR